MPVPADLIERKEAHFVLWRPSANDKPPRLVIGRFQPGNPPQLADEQSFPLEQDAQKKGLWSIAASDCGLESGHVYHYWFEVEDTNPQRRDAVPAKQVRCTDPAAYTVDWRLLAPPLPPPFTEDNRQPAAVIKFENDRLLAADPGGEAAAFPDDPGPDTLPANNRLVIYELPTAWSRSGGLGPGERAVGTFQDVLALIDEAAGGANFVGVHALRAGHSYLGALGINALELLPAQDSFFKRAWGYDTAHFLAPDFELGFPDGNSWPTANLDLAKLVESAHQNGIRFFIDVVMAFARQEAYQAIDFDDFYIEDPFRHQDDPDALTSGRGGDGHKEVRDGFGSTLLRYTRATGTPVYDPVSGNNMVLVPARGLMYSFITRWMRDFHVDGVRMDSVENVANWDFVGGFKDRARQLWQDRWQAAGLGAGADERFLVVGEELSEPMQLLTQNRLDGLWNDSFRQLVRAAILGEAAPGEATFESTVRKAIDCRQLGFADGAQAVNYITSHDVQGFRRERLFNMLVSSGLRDLELQKRIELAFVCLLTAVGIPMLLAGEEFADQHDLFDAQGHVSETGGKQVDPVDFTRANEPWRKVVLDYVARLVHFRTTHPALAVNDTEFLHIDFNDGKRVLAWKRGSPGQDPVVVVANFSDFSTQNALSDPRAEYVVHNWSATPPGRHWREVTQDRDVRPDQVGREPIFSWEAKVYTIA
jgi:pullulanase